MSKKIKKSIIFDTWNCCRRIGTEVKCNESEYRAFKLDGEHKIKKFHVTQIMTEPYIPFPKNIKTKTVYKLVEYGDQYVNEFDSIDEVIKYLRRSYDDSVTNFDVKNFIKHYSIIPIIKFVVE